MTYSDGVLVFGLGTRECYASITQAGRLTPEEQDAYEWGALEPDLQASAAHGFYWFSYLPRLRWNGGRFGRHECVDVTLTWLCWSLIFTAHVPTSRARRRS